MWLPVVIIAYFLNAIALAVDKKLLNKDIPQPAVYTFYIAALGLLVWVLAPWGWHWAGSGIFLYSLLAGVLFTTALLIMFMAVSRDEVSRITPIIGGFSPLFVFFLAWWWLGEALSGNQLWAFVLVVLGSLLISMRWRQWRKTQWRALVLAILSAAIFGAHYVLSKFIYERVDFITGFIDIRTGAFLGALLLLLIPAWRYSIFHRSAGNNKQTAGWFLTGQTTGALSAVMVNWAVALGSVTLVNALQGLQYVFLFFIVLLMARIYPSWLKEENARSVWWQKALAIILISIGIYLLA